jgi:hypothetical protein
MKTFKAIREAKNNDDEMFGWIIDKLENSKMDSSKMKKEFTKKFGASATKKHFDNMVTTAMDG